jgi:hypothetical protein
MKTGKKEWEYSDKRIMFSSVTCSPDSKNIYAAGSDGTIKELSADGVFVRDLPFKTQVNNVLLARTGRYFFASMLLLIT